jgi:DNA polymerase-4
VSDTIIAHVDLDAFFASVEQRDNPEYRLRPVIVGALPGKRGVVAACSYEARVFGIHSAMPIAQAYKRCPDAVYLRPGMGKYSAESKRIMAVLETITPALEKASIDEAYLDISGLEKHSGSPEQIGQTIRERIYKETGLTASVGIGPNRLIAKLGSEACKPDGLKVIPQDEVLDFLAPMPVRNLRGLGKQTHKIFDRMGIETVAELRNYPLQRLQKHLGLKAAASFKRQADGIASSVINTEQGRKSISKETTFEADERDHDKLHDTLHRLAAQVASTARRNELAGKVVTLKVRYRGFDTFTRQRTLPEPTNDERVLLTTVWSLFNKGDLPDKPVRLIGLGISDWETVQAEQTDMFAAQDQKQADKKILDTIDSVAEKYGKPILQVGMAKKSRSS